MMKLSVDLKQVDQAESREAKSPCAPGPFPHPQPLHLGPRPFICPKQTQSEGPLGPRIMDTYN